MGLVCPCSTDAPLHPSQHRISKLLFLFFTYCAVVHSPTVLAQEEAQKQVLLAIKRDFIDAGGLLADWDESSTSSVCQWTGVRCGRGNASATVEDLSLSNLGEDSTKKLGGSISTEIGNLTGLITLDISNNELEGTIPGSIGGLRALKSLTMSENNLNGTLPNLNSLENLEELDFSRNRLEGSMPSGIANLRNLKILDLSYNDLIGTIPVLDNVIHLVTLILSNNYLEGPLPSGIAKMVNLSLFDVSHNKLTGIIPSLDALVNLETLDLSNNQLEGPIPSGIANMPQIRTIVLSDNKLNGTLASLDGLQGVTKMNLSHNQVEGPIPPAFGGISDLDLSSNNLTGVIPREFGQGTRDSLDLSANQLNGSLTVALLLGVQDSLNVSFNSLEGVEDEAALMNSSELSMTYLDLSHNRLTTFPPRLSLRNLLVVRMQHNHLAIRVDQFQLDVGWRLQDLQLAGNNLIGTLEIRAGGGRNLQVLDVSLNPMVSLFRGFLQILFLSSLDLQYLNLSRINSTGGLPQILGELTSLTVLDLSSSTLLGSLSTEWSNGTLPVLRYIDLSNNRLTGGVPNSVCDMEGLAYLNLSENSLSGQLPYGSCRLRNATSFFGNPGLCGPPLKECSEKSGPGALVVVLSVSIAIAVGSCGLLVWRSRVYRRKHRQDADLIAVLRESATLTMPLKDLRKATNNFTESRKIGAGGFGTVYRGIVSDGSVVAVKKSNHDGPDLNKTQFLNEVKILSRVNHVNLVKLYGCCLENRVAALVFEYVPNGTLLDHLRRAHGEAPLTWRSRLTIGVQTAGALAYLHDSADPVIYHLDVKSANILLTESLKAKVADFGISKLAPRDNTQTLHVAGTYGYMDPEYFGSGMPTPKSDVYSFGVILLELISAQAVIDRSGTREEYGLSAYALPLIRSGQLLKLVDPVLSQGLDFASEMEEITSVAKLAARCLRDWSKDRPSMDEVFKELQSLLPSADSSADPVTSEDGNYSYHILDDSHSFEDDSISMALLPQRRVFQRSSTSGSVELVQNQRHGISFIRSRSQI